METIVKTTSRSRSSLIESATVQPSSASGSALAFVRFHTVMSVPARASRAAMAAPIRPVPIQPTRGAGEATESFMWQPLQSFVSR